MLRRRAAAALAGLTSLALAPTVAGSNAPAAHGEPLPSYTEYVALGDSWSADVVLFDRNGFPDATHAPVGLSPVAHELPQARREGAGGGDLPRRDLWLGHDGALHAAAGATRWAA